MQNDFVHGKSQVADTLLAEFCNRKTPYQIEAFGLPIQVEESVYPPETDEITLQYFDTDGAALLHTGVRVLDYGTGSGILAIYAAKRGALVTATDINRKAVECAKYNCRANGVEVKLIESDGFSQIPKDQQFDIILASIPWESATANSATMEVAFYDPDFKMRRNLFETGYDYLHPEGCILLSYSQRVERINPMSSFSDRFDFQLVYQVPAADGNEETYLFKATKKRV